MYKPNHEGEQDRHYQRVLESRTLQEKFRDNRTVRENRIPSTRLYMRTGSAAPADCTGNITNGTYGGTGSPSTGEYYDLYVKANPLQKGRSRHERKGISDRTIRNRPTMDRQNRIEATKAGRQDCHKRDYVDSRDYNNVSSLGRRHHHMGINDRCQHAYNRCDKQELGYKRMDTQGTQCGQGRQTEAEVKSFEFSVCPIIQRDKF
jgi:hypothetical protein